MVDKLKISKSDDSDFNTLNGLGFLNEFGKDIKEDEHLNAIECPKGLESHFEIIEKNYPKIIEYMQKEYPSVFRMANWGSLGLDKKEESKRLYLLNTENVDNKKITELSDFVAENIFLKNENNNTREQKIADAAKWLSELGEDVSWSREKYIRNFPAILTYLEKHDGIDVSELRQLHNKEVERRRQSSTYQRWGEMHILEPNPSIETKLEKLVRNKKFADVKEPEKAHRMLMKYFRVTVLNEVIEQQNQIAQAKGMGKKYSK